MIDAGRTSTRRFGTLCVAVSFWFGVEGGPVLAAEFSYLAGYSLSYDSNINRVETDPVSERTQTLSAGFVYRENTADLNARLLARMEKRYYARDTFSDSSDDTYHLAGTAVWTVLPRNFFWTVDDTFQEVRSDLTVADTPANRTETNSLSTGPDVTLRLGTANSLALGARYGRFDIRGPGDNERYSGQARLLRRVSAATTLSLSYVATREYFEPGGLYTKAFREDRFISYATREPTSDVTIDLGTTSHTPEGGQKQSGRLARLSAGRQIASASMLRASLADEISDTFTSLLGAGASGAPIGAQPATPDSYRNQVVDLALATQVGRFGYTLRGNARRVDYRQLPQDYEEKGGRLGWTWLYSADTRVIANADYLRRTFLSFERTDVEQNIRAGVTYRLTSNVSVLAEGLRTETESTAAGATFVSWRALLALAYGSGPLHWAQMGQ